MSEFWLIGDLRAALWKSAKGLSFKQVGLIVAFDMYGLFHWLDRICLLLDSTSKGLPMLPRLISEFLVLVLKLYISIVLNTFMLCIDSLLLLLSRVMFLEGSCFLLKEFLRVAFRWNYCICFCFCSLCRLWKELSMFKDFLISGSNSSSILFCFTALMLTNRCLFLVSYLAYIWASCIDEEFTGLCPCSVFTGDSHYKLIIGFLRC